MRLCETSQTQCSRLELRPGARSVTLEPRDVAAHAAERLVDLVRHRLADARLARWPRRVLGLASLVDAPGAVGLQRQPDATVSVLIDPLDCRFPGRGVRRFLTLGMPRDGDT